jgi:hypothetical protein
MEDGQLLSCSRDPLCGQPATQARRQGRGCTCQPANNALHAHPLRYNERGAAPRRTDVLAVGELTQQACDAPGWRGSCALWLRQPAVHVLQFEAPAWSSSHAGLPCAGCFWLIGCHGLLVACHVMPFLRTRMCPQMHHSVLGWASACKQQMFSVSLHQYSVGTGGLWDQGGDISKLPYT